MVFFAWVAWFDLYMAACDAVDGLFSGYVITYDIVIRCFMVIWFWFLGCVSCCGCFVSL